VVRFEEDPQAHRLFLSGHGHSERARAPPPGPE
jgi:hypothetical protein